MKLRKLVAVMLLAFLTLVIYDGLSYFFNTDIENDPFISNNLLSVIVANGVSSNSRQNVSPKKLQIHENLVSKHPFLLEKIINPHNFEYIIGPNVNCSHRDVELLICVPISSDNIAGRSVIRKTWGSYAKDPNNKAVLLFFIGSEQEESESRVIRQSRLMEEASKFGDIVQENYIDSYRNLSLKSVSILRWVNSFCSNAKYILKVDDDVYVNIPLLMKTLQEFVVQSSPPSAHMTGHEVWYSMPYRNPSSKWYTPFSVYGHLFLPPYLSGPLYVMTNEAVNLIYEASLRVSTFWMEDVYITGMCAAKAEVPIYNNKYIYIANLLASGCSFQTVAASHEYTLEEIVKIHKQLYDPHFKC